MDKTCIKCGRCLAVCPVYKATGQERFSPRGKNSLIKLFQDQLLPPSSLFHGTLSACILCGQCTERCVLSINTPDRIHKLRTSFWPQQKRHLYRAWLAEQLLASFHKELGIWLRLLILLNQIKPLPISPALKPFLSQISSSSPSPSSIAIFVGCGVNFIYPSLGQKLINILTALNHRVAIPQEQTCCGLMAYTLGDMQTALKLAQKNIAVFSHLNPEVIITPCASCYHHLKIFPPYQEAGISAKVVEISQFLVNKNIPLASLSEKITWHDPCHLRFHHQIWKEPRTLLNRAGHFVESSPQGQCCGHGGSFALNFPDLSKEIFNRRKKAIEESKAKFIFTSCMGCLIQLQLYLGKERVRHILDIFA